MTRKTIEREFRKLQSAMRLDHWRIALRFDVVEEDAYADVKVDGDVYDVATVTIGPEAELHVDTDRMRAILAHELMHCHTRDVRRANELVLELVPESQRDFVRKHLEDVEESLVDRLAYVVVDLGDAG